MLIGGVELIISPSILLTLLLCQPYIFFKDQFLIISVLTL